MAHPAPFLRLVCSGILHTEEGFSFGLSLIRSGDGAVPETVPQAVENAVRTWHEGTSSSAALLNSIKLNLIGTDGRYVDKFNTVERVLATPIVGGSAPQHPAQIALAVTLSTGVKRGLAASGRFYIPSPQTGGIEADGLISASAASGIVTKANSLVNALNSALPGWHVGVSSSEREGGSRLVNQVRVGRVLDTIRSRRASLGEAYAVGPVIDVPDFPFGGGGGSF